MFFENVFYDVRLDRNVHGLAILFLKKFKSLRILVGGHNYSNNHNYKLPEMFWKVSREPECDNRFFLAVWILKMIYPFNQKNNLFVDFLFVIDFLLFEICVTNPEPIFEI